MKEMLFCLMSNHIHLLIRQNKEGGIIKFVSKIGIGLGKYLNIKYDRKGHVFQDRFRSILIKDDVQLRHIFVYINANPISIIEPKWKEIGIREPEKVVEFLENYKWSSYLDYIGKKNFPSVTDREFFLKVMKSEQGCKDQIEGWIKYKGDIEEFSHFILED